MARLFSPSQILEKSTAVINAQPMTMAGWVWATASLASNMRCMGIGAKSPTHFDILAMAFLTASQKMSALVTNTSAITDTTAIASTALTAGAWFHCAVVHQSSSSRSAYINGGSKVTSVVTGFSVTAVNLNSTALGGYYNNGASSVGWNGRLAFNAFWNAALSDADILSLSQGASPKLIRPGSLVSYTRMTGGSSPEADYTMSTPWTLTGASSEIANPLIYYP